MGKCPRCHRENSQTIREHADRIIFKCHNCGLRYGQRKAFPHHYFRVRRKSRPSKSFPQYIPSKQNKHGKAIAATILIAAFLLVMWYVASPYSGLMPSTSSPTKSPTAFSSPTPYSSPPVFSSPAQSSVFASPTSTPTQRRY